MNIFNVNYHDTFLNKKNIEINLYTIIISIFKLIKYIISQLIKDIIFLFKNNNIDKRIIFYAQSVNQHNAIKTLKDKYDKSLIIGLDIDSNNRLPMGIGCLLSIILSPLLFLDYLKSQPRHRYILISNFENYFCIRGMYIWWRMYLKIKKPKMVVMSNDHLVWPRTLRMAAQINCIPVVYIQHASVTELFPMLEFDLSLLEGKDAFIKYKKKGLGGKVELVGMLKHDKYYNLINNSQEVNTIGICTNILDHEHIICEFVAKLYTQFSEKVITIRPHPRDERFDLYQHLKNKFGIQISDSKKVASFDYLKNIDINIASETSIHLEAVLLNVYPIYFKLKDEITDFYGYINNGLLTDVYENVNDLSDRIKELERKRPYVRRRAKYYINNVDTKYDGKSMVLAKNAIDDILKEIKI